MTGENIILTQMSHPNETVSITLIPLISLQANNFIILKDFLESFDDNSWFAKAQKTVEQAL